MTCRLTSCLHHGEPEPCPVHPPFTVPPTFDEEDPRLYDAARRACHDSGVPWTDPRTGITWEPPAATLTDDQLRDLWRSVQGPRAELNGPLIRFAALVLRAGLSRPTAAPSLTDESDGSVDRLQIRVATDAEQREAILKWAQQAHRAGSGHDCGEWLAGYRCTVCGSWVDPE